MIEHKVPESAIDFSSYLPRVDQFYLPEWFTIQFLTSNIISFTPLLSYGTTVLSISRCKTALGFSIDICATMLIASVLRISYYMITPYELALLRQSVVMIFIQLILLRTSLKYRPEQYKYDNLKDTPPLTTLLQDVWNEFFETTPSHRNYADRYMDNVRRETSWVRPHSRRLTLKNLLLFCHEVAQVLLFKFLKFFDPGYKRFWSFWQWNDDSTYWNFLLIFISCQLLITFFVSKVLAWDELAHSLGSIIGSLGLLVEALLPLPQISILHTLKSVQGFKLILLLSWLGGDVLKITYLLFGAKNVSTPFFFFAFLQMSLNLYIGGQYIYYKYYYISPTTVPLDVEAGIEASVPPVEEIELSDLRSIPIPRVDSSVSLESRAELHGRPFILSNPVAGENRHITRSRVTSIPQGTVRR